jgi:hypothetical protein
MNVEYAKRMLDDLYGHCIDSNGHVDLNGWAKNEWFYVDSETDLNVYCEGEKAMATVYPVVNGQTDTTDYETIFCSKSNP